MNIKTDGDYEYRLDLMRRVMQRTDENTRSGAIDRSMEGYLHLLDALERAVEHPDMTKNLAEILSTPYAEVVYDLNTNVKADKRHLHPIFMSDNGNGYVWDDP